ncbi:isocitrate lyase [Penicillium atrosanguineum]|uniref:Isocitrate lyase n=1 Tax=Penicillium atrosanguineum TaxID=1132637 RepID=A0A9W9TZD7_9EURO|nr:isocitrate lyase [Penicillium atrosanguineum]KAJ5119946.1 isocitrate lyase [Penicillium atrosanguineum]KAJ5299706.1 isocitrate lyase [Penicillium atrosanguineum]
MMPQSNLSLDAEQAIFDKDVADIKAWWDSSVKQRQLKRPYPAERIAALRSSIKQHYPSSDMALKLWEQMNEHNESGTCDLTFGCTDPLQAGVMAKYQQTVYVSGALCGYSRVSQPGMDHADYPWDTVPETVNKIFRSQQWQDQRQRQFRFLYPKEERETLDNWDFLTPIVADGDMGFGGITHTMKLTRAFVEAGVAMFHLDDLAIGAKKFTTGEGRTVVPTSEYLSRLTAARMQIDIMGAETILMCRCDTDHSSYISSVIDTRDHAWVLGATKDVEPLAKVLSAALLNGEDVLSAQKAWLVLADLKTFDDAVSAIAKSSPGSLQAYKAAIAEVTTQISTPSLHERRAIAAKYISQPLMASLFFDWDLPRTPEGSYRWAPDVEAVVSRALLAAGLGEITWSRMDYPVKSDIEAFHLAVRKVHHDRKFGFGYTGGYDWLKAGWTAEEVKEFPWESAKKYGVVWHVQPIWALQGQRRAVEEFSRLWQKGGIAAYMNKVQGQELGERYPGLESREYAADGITNPEDGYARFKFSGAYLADALLETATMGVNGVDKELVMGQGVVKGPRANRFG